MSDYLNTLTVKALREIAKRIGFRFISRYRKAELIDLISAEINACHIEAIREDKIRTRQSAPKISLIDFPAVRMANSNPIDDVIRFANEAIAALMPNLAATKLAFETLRDDESANPNHVDLAYQVYSDTHRSIEEYRRTIAYAESA